MGERAEDAVIREIREELGVEMKILRPLWLNQAFFNEDVSTMDYHELCIYFLMDYEGTDLLERGEKFIRKEGGHIFTFEWLEKERLKSEYFYPVFLKTEIFSLPSSLTLRTEME